MLHAGIIGPQVQKQNKGMPSPRFDSIPVFAKKKTTFPPIMLSPSSIATFRQCKLQYKYHYVDKLAAQYGKPRPYYTMANHVHATLHDLLLFMPITNRTAETAKRLLSNNWRRYRVGFCSRADEKRWAQRALDEVTRFVAEQDITVTPMMLEAPIEAEVTPGLTLRGRVDRVDRERDGTLHIIDYKTGAMPDDIDWNQLQLHALILSRCGPYIVSRVSYLYLLAGKMETRQLDVSVLEKTTWEVLRIAKEIHKEKNYRPSPGPACAGCDFAVICPTKNGSYVETGEVELPLWRDFSDILLAD